MDSFGNYPREKFDPFSVMLFKGLQVVAFLFFIALLAMNPEAKSGKIDTKAEFIISMTWPDSHPDDIDLYAEDPARQHRLVPRARGRLHGARPRRPRRAQQHHRGQRPQITSPIRQETVSIRGIVPGEYTVNVNHYLATPARPVPVAVKVEKVNPAGRGRALRHHHRSITPATSGPRCASGIADNGNIVDVNHREKSLIQLTRSVRRTGKVADGRGTMTSTVLAISAAYVVLGVLLLTLGLPRASPGG